MLCRHHGSVKKAVARVKEPVAYGVSKPLDFVFPEDRAAVQLNLFLVLQALNHKQIDHTTANTMNRVLNSCAENLGRRAKGDTLVQSTEDVAVQHVILTPEGEEIAPPREALEAGEVALVHQKNCPCQRCAERYRNAEPEVHHAECACGLCSADGSEMKAPALSLFLAEPEEKAVKKEFSLDDFLFGDAKKRHEAEYAARAREAMEAGQDAPELEAFDAATIESEATKRYKAEMEAVERNRQAAQEAWARRFPEEMAGARV
jgi:hypothetical protein